MRAGVRLDKWLWSARFYKTRTLATEAVKKGKIRVNGTKVNKPSKLIQGDERLLIEQAHRQADVRVVSLIDKRVGAKHLDQVYVLLHEVNYKANGLLAQMDTDTTQIAVRERGSGRPTKKQRRQTEQWLDR